MDIIFFLISGTRYQRILQLDDILQILFALTKYIRKKKWEQKMCALLSGPTEAIWNWEG